MIDILERLANSSCNESSHELQCRCFDAAEEVSRLRAALQTQAEEAAKHNAWMSQVHGLCFDLGIAPGHIEDRLFEAIGRVNMLIEQRDELLGALKLAWGFIPVGMTETDAIIKAAITKATT